MQWSHRTLARYAAVLIFLAGVASAAPAGKIPKVVHSHIRSTSLKTTAGGTLSVAVVSLAANTSLNDPLGGSAVLDLGTVSYSGTHRSEVNIARRKDSFTAGADFGLLVKDTARQTNFATVSAWVAGADQRLNYWVDGQRLGPAPVVIAPHAAVGGVTRHQLMVEIPNSLTERSAQLQVALQFEVTPN